ncbi:MAG: CheY-like chemotaxis protein [Pirellulaceae bacterium]|jgi:CheY-like chemotaxis protein
MKDKTFRVLLVEEEQVLAEITSFRLELLGYQVHTVGSAEDAIVHLQATEDLPHGIVVDLTLPGMNGIQLIERLGADEKTTKIPVMALSHEADLDAVQNAFVAGASDYLVAPYNPITLEDKVEEMVRRSDEAVGV